VRAPVNQRLRGRVRVEFRVDVLDFGSAASIWSCSAALSPRLPTLAASATSRAAALTRAAAEHNPHEHLGRYDDSSVIRRTIAISIRLAIAAAEQVERHNLGRLEAAARALGGTTPALAYAVHVEAGSPLQDILRRPKSEIRIGDFRQFAISDFRFPVPRLGPRSARG